LDSSAAFGDPTPKSDAERTPAPLDREDGPTISRTNARSICRSDSGTLLIGLCSAAPTRP
jgi:hypothetical protein